MKELPQHGAMNMEEKQLIPIVSVKGSPRRPSSFLVDAPLKKFLPKYGKAKGQLYSQKHAPVFITSASLLTQVYIRIVDGYYFRYRKMMQESQDEFRSVTQNCASFCPSPVVGHAYATKVGAYWCRVLIEEMGDKRKMAYQVDRGHRHVVLPFMVFHKLPDKFMELPAQAIRCVLDGVFLPSTTESFDKNNIGDKKWDASSLQSQFLEKYRANLPLLFSPSGRGMKWDLLIELQIENSLLGLFCILRTELRDQQIEFQEHYEICKRLVSLNAWSARSSHLKTLSVGALVTEQLYQKNPDIVQDISIIVDDFLFATSNHLPNIEKATTDPLAMLSQ